MPFFPLGGINAIQSLALSAIAQRLHATTQQVALAWLMARAPNVLLIPVTSSLSHLRENLAAAELVIGSELRAEFEEI